MLKGEDGALDQSLGITTRIMDLGTKTLPKRSGTSKKGGHRQIIARQNRKSKNSRGGKRMTRLGEVIARTIISRINKIAINNTNSQHHQMTGKIVAGVILSEIQTPPIKVEEEEISSGEAAEEPPKG